MTAADDLRALSAAATPGPWQDDTYAPANPDRHRITAGTSFVSAVVFDPADAELIVWLRNHAAALADLIDAASDHTTTEDVGDEWREHARLRFMDALAALEADR